MFSANQNDLIIDTAEFIRWVSKFLKIQIIVSFKLYNRVSCTAKTVLTTLKDTLIILYIS